MRPRSVPILVGITGVATLLLLALVLGFPGSSIAQAPPKAADLPPGYAGAEACKGCHENQFTRFEHTKMGRLFVKFPRNTREALACEVCHGPGKAHADAGGGKGVGHLVSFAKNDPTPVEKRNDVCLTCHSKGNHIFWKGSAHESRDVPCTGCHTIMQNVSPRAQLKKPTEIETCGACHVQKRAQQMRYTHMPLREGKMTCTSCHNPHGTTTQSLLKENSINDTCFTCHAEKRGPFLWDHDPVVENCDTCHDPHGSNHERMLKMPRPRICQTCHVPNRHPTAAYGPEFGSVKYTRGLSCSNCHIMIHGSNHPSGKALTR